MKLGIQLKRKYLRYINPLVQNYMPRRFILLIDLVIVACSALAAFFTVLAIRELPFKILDILIPLSIIILVQGLYFIIFKSYTGLVRYSSLRDAGKKFQVVLLCVVTLLIGNQIVYSIIGEQFVRNSELIIYGVFSFSLLFLFRIAVKETYALLIESKPSRKALVLGMQPDDVAMASGLIAHGSDEFSVVGFIDDRRKLLKNDVFGLPIYNLEKLKKQNLIVDAVIVSEEKLSRLRRLDTNILSDLLDLDLRIFKLPKLQDWQDVSDNDFKKLRAINFEDLLRRAPIKLNNEKLFSLYENKTILITGAAGSIGSEIIRQLLVFKPEKLLLIDQAETPLHQLTLELDQKKPHQVYEKIIANVRNKKRMQQVIEEFQPEVVFHAAAYKHVPMMEANHIEALSVNFQGTRNMAELAAANKAERFIFVSTDKAVNPTNIMGATKRAAELFIQHINAQHGIETKFITTRFGNVLGSNGSVVPHFKSQIEANGPVTVTHPEITRYFMTIDEACQLVLEAGAMGEGGEIYVFDMGKPVKIIDLAEQMIRLSGHVPHKDIKIKFTGLRPGEKLYEELLADKENTKPTHHEKILIGRAAHDFGDVELSNLCDVLLEAVLEFDKYQALDLLKALVPEYEREQSIALTTKNTEFSTK